MDPIKIEIVKEYSEELLAAMQSLIPQLTSSVGEIQEQVIKDIVAANNTHLFVVKVNDDKIIGALTLVVFTIPTSKKAYIEDVVLDATCQGKGIGRKLMEEAIRVAKEKGVSRIELTSSPSRVAANKLYQSLGFKVRETNFYRLQLS